MTRHTHLKHANRLPETAMDNNIVHHPVSKVPAPFCTMRCKKNEKYLQRDEVPDGERQPKERKKSVEFYQNEYASSAISLKSYKLLAVRAWKN